MKNEAFEIVKHQIGYCGIWCGSCIAGNGALRELTRRYRQGIDKYGLKEWAPGDFDYDEFAKGLTSIQNMALCPGCLKGGGRDDCEMKACASGRNIKDCSMCDSPDVCRHTESLKKMREGALEAGLYVKTRKADNSELIKDWISEMKVKWPNMILFIED